MVESVAIARLEERMNSVEDADTDINTRFDRLEAKFDAMRAWLVTAVGGLATACVLLVINIVLQRG